MLFIACFLMVFNLLGMIIAYPAP